MTKHIGDHAFKKALTLKTEGTLDDHAVTKGYVDSIVQGLGWTVLDKDLTDPPGSPPTGGRYIVASVATGDWTGHEEKIAEWSGSAWSFETPSEGWEIWVVDENVWYVYDGAHPAGSWVKLGSTITHSNLLGLDVPDDHLSYLTLDGLRPMTGLLTTPGIKIPVDGDIKIYNTVDQTTHYERAVFEWIPGIFKISTQKGGSGLNRAIDIVNAWGTGFRLNDAIMALKGSSGGEYLINADSFASLALRGRIGNTNTQSVRLGNSATFSSTNGQQTFVAVTANLGQSGTAGYTALEIDAIEGSVGSGAKNLIDAKVDGVSKLICDNTGLLSFGPKTAAFPAWKRDGTALGAWLADNSAYTAVKCSEVRVFNVGGQSGYLNHDGSNLFVGDTAGTVIFSPGGNIRGWFDTSGLTITRDCTVYAAQLFRWANSTRMSAPADGQILFTDATAVDFGLLQFGGTTNAFPAWKRDTVNLRARLANDSADTGVIAARFETAKTMDTLEGGRAIKLTNKTGVASVKGIVVKPSSSTDYAVDVCDADGVDPIGVVYEDGIADGSEVWVVISGIAEVLLEDSTATTRGYWARTSITQAGRADITAALPPEGTIQALENHFSEIGHSIQSVTAGTDKLARIVMHIN